MHADQISDSHRLQLSDRHRLQINHPDQSQIGGRHDARTSDQPRSHFNGAVIGYLIMSTAVAFGGSVIGMLGFPVPIMLGVFLINLGAAQLSRKLLKNAGFPDHSACAISMAVMGTVFGPAVYFVLVTIARLLPH